MDTELIQRPRTLDTEEYVRARIEQISELLEVVDNPALGLGEVTSGPRTVFQRLPRHMRRRAMSHNVKRLPRALRPIAARHTLRTAHRKKAPSRKWRRRPTRMLKLKNDLPVALISAAAARWVREQRKNIWLETHIWHAKRFHMTDLWGYKLPLRSCQRGFRPNYRCSVRSAVALDQSYLCCLQFVVTAPLSTDCKMQMLSEILSRFCQKKVSSTFAHSGAMSAHQEVSVVLFSPGKYPNGLLGPGRAMWTNGGCLLLWVHPSIERQLVAEMTKVPQICVVPPTKIAQMEKDDQTQSEQSKKQIELVSLRNRLCRFHLIGPKAVEFLRKMIRVANEKEKEEEEPNCGNYWLQFREMHRWWRTLGANVLPGNVRDGQILALLVEDPRLFRAVPTPQQKQQQQEQQGHQQHRSPLSPPSPLLCAPPSALFADWQFFHQHLLPKRLSHSAFESFCADKLARPKRTEFKIPILLVFRHISAPSSSPKNIALDCVDLICPSGVGYGMYMINLFLARWGRRTKSCSSCFFTFLCFHLILRSFSDFWLALQFAGFRPIGLHDKRALDFEAGICTFPDDFVECCAGTEAAQAETKHLEEKYKRKPHNRRVPFGQGLNVAHPFTFEWERLLSEWDTAGEGQQMRSSHSDNNNKLSFFVLRDRQALKRLDLWLCGRNAKESDGSSTMAPMPRLEAECFGDADTFAFSSVASSALVPVSLRMARRGVPKRLSLISLPTDQDMQMLRGTHDQWINNKIVIKEEMVKKLCIANTSDTTDENNEWHQMTTELSRSTPSPPAARHIPEFISLNKHNQRQRTAAHYFPTDETCVEEQLLSLEAMFSDGGVDDKERRRKARNVCKRAKKRAKMIGVNREKTTTEQKGDEKGEEEERGKRTEMEIGEEGGQRTECITTTRKLIGRVVRGDYAFGTAQGMALGFVPLNALEAVARTDRIVLVRNTTSKYHHPAKLHIHLVEQNMI